MIRTDWMADAVRDTRCMAGGIEELLKIAHADRDRYRQAAQETGRFIWTQQQEDNYQELVKALDRAAHLADDAAKRWRRAAERYGAMP